jgi:hypothetical protein
MHATRIFERGATIAISGVAIAITAAMSMPV